MVPRRCSPSNAMTTHENKTAMALVHLGITRPEELSALFADLRGRFDADCASAHDESAWKQFRDAWLGRKSGVLTQITDNWLKPAEAALKRAVGASLNELRAHGESQIEARRARQPASPAPKNPPSQERASPSLSPAFTAPSALIT